MTLMNWLNRKEGMNVKMYHKILKKLLINLININLQVTLVMYKIGLIHLVV